MSDSDKREKPVIAAFDFDGTLIPFDAFLPFLRFVVGRKRLYFSCIKIFPALFFGRQKVKEALLTELFRKDAYEKLQEAAQRFYDEKIKPNLKLDQIVKLRWHQSQGHRVVIVSANIEPLLEPFVKDFDIELIASIVELDKQGRITGLLKGKNCRCQEKVRRLEKLCGPLDQVTLFAYGDSRGDHEMLEAAHHPTKV